MRGLGAIIGFFVGVGLTDFIVINIAPVLLTIRAFGTLDAVVVLSSSRDETPAEDKGGGGTAAADDNDRAGAWAMFAYSGRGGSTGGIFPNGSSGSTA